jgi:hypothetical protein
MQLQILGQAVAAALRGGQVPELHQSITDSVEEMVQTVQ